MMFVLKCPYFLLNVYYSVTEVKDHPPPIHTADQQGQQEGQQHSYDHILRHNIRFEFEILMTLMFTLNYDTSKSNVN